MVCVLHLSPASAHDKNNAIHSNCWVIDSSKFEKVEQLLISFINKLGNLEWRQHKNSSTQTKELPEELRDSYGKTQKFTNTLASFIVYKINYYIKDIWVNQLYG